MSYPPPARVGASVCRRFCQKALSPRRGVFGWGAVPSPCGWSLRRGAFPGWGRGGFALRVVAPARRVSRMGSRCFYLAGGRPGAAFSDGARCFRLAGGRPGAARFPDGVAVLLPCGWSLRRGAFPGWGRGAFALRVVAPARRFRMGRGAFALRVVAPSRAVVVFDGNGAVRGLSRRLSAFRCVSSGSLCVSSGFCFVSRQKMPSITFL